ncbi:hypothetical protein NliqN6_3451 [Naganishia liquefaciens]|uniref:Uncharacterized protein n=1 Tax=Naganishia liquefaciens TaxID=104408 RepID=A0A8H3TVQ2_9TREE|nr:hypothetical protein NliqN6_3451 [Naganishia liquefaciens]
MFSCPTERSGFSVLEMTEPGTLARYTANFVGTLEKDLETARAADKDSGPTWDSEDGTAIDNPEEPIMTANSLGAWELRTWRHFARTIAEAITSQEDVEDQWGLAQMFLDQVRLKLGDTPEKSNNMTDQVLQSSILPELRGAQLEFVRRIFTDALTTKAKRVEAEHIQRKHELKCLEAFLRPYTREARESRERARSESTSSRRKADSSDE